MKRSDGERVRLQHSIPRLRATLDSIELNVRMGGPASEAASTLVQSAIEVAMQISKLDAFELAEHDITLAGEKHKEGCMYNDTYHDCVCGLIARQRAAAGEAKKPCTRPPPGWWCSRGEHEDGPCAARRVGESMED